MPEIQKSILPPRQTTRPRCSVCQWRMQIQRIAKARAGFEHWRSAALGAVVSTKCR
jgi:hypothetical protein